MTDAAPAGPRPEDLASPADLAAALTSLRTLHGGSVRDVAKAADLPSSTLGGYFSGRHLPPLTRPQALVALLSALGVGAEEHSAWLAALQRAHRRRTSAHTTEPYRGLESFGAGDARVFFGREADTEALRSLVDGVDHGLIVVLGASGSGKSSLVQAGLLASLAPGQPATVIRPGGDLLRALDELSSPQVSQASPAESGLGGEVLVVIDQFEELWTRSSQDHARDTAIGHVTALANRPGHRVILVVRSDFYGQMAMVPDFVDALRYRSFLVSAMGPLGLTRAITGPAAEVGLTCEPVLVDRFLGDLTAGGSDLTGVLPHLSHTLRLLWEHSDRRRLTLADYEAVGGVGGAIARSAEEAYAGLSPSQRELAVPLLLRLVVVDEDQVPTGGSLVLDSSVGEVEEDVLDHFARHRLISMDDLQARFSHETVLTVWDRLADWIETARARLSLEQVLDRESRAWRASGHEDGLLLRGTRLDAATSWAEDPAAHHTPERHDFVAASLGARQMEAGAVTRRLRRTRILLAAVSVAAIAAMVATTMAFTTSRSRAEERTTARAGQLAAESARFAPTDPMVSRELAVAGFREASTLQTRAAVIGVTGTPAMTTLTLPVGSPAIGADPRGAHMAIGTVGSTFQMLDVSQAAPRVIATPPSPSTTASDTIDAFSWAGGQPVLAVITFQGAGLVYDVSDPTQPVSMGAFTVPTYFGGGLDLSPDGSTLVVGTRESGIHVFAVDRATRSVTPQATITSDLPVASISFLPDGRLLTGSTLGVLTLRDASAAHAPVSTTQLGNGRVARVRVSGDAAYAATRRENIAYRIPLVGDGFGPWSKVAGFDSWVNDVGVSPDGHFITFVSADGTARTADATGQVITSMTMPDNMVHGVYLTDGRLVLGVVTGQVVIRGTWAPAADNPTSKLFASAWSRDGKTLLTFPDAPGDQTRLWDVSDPDNPTVKTVLGGVPDGIQTNGMGDLSPDGHTVIAGTLQGVLMVWKQAADGTWSRGVATSFGTTNLGGTKFTDDHHVFVIDDDHQVLLVDLTGPEAVVTQRFEGAPDQATPVSAGVAVGKGVYAVGFDSGVTLVWSGTTPQPVASIPGEGLVFGEVFSADGKHLLIAGQSGQIRIFDVSTSTSPRLVEELIGATAGLQDVDLASDGSIAGAVSDGTVVLFRPTATGHELVARLPSSARLFAVRFSPDGKRLAGVGMKATALVWTVDPAAAATQICRRLGTPMTTTRWAALLPGVPYRRAC